MKKQLKTLCLSLFFLCILTACRDPEEIKWIGIVYLPELTTTMTPIENANDLLSYSDCDTVIRSRRFLQSFNLELSKLTPLDSVSFPNNFRIWCHVERRNGEVNDLLLGAFWGTVYDGVDMYDNLALYRLIKEEIYEEGNKYQDMYERRLQKE